MSDEKPTGTWWAGPSKDGNSVGTDTNDRAEWLRRLAIAEERWGLKRSELAERFVKGPRLDERGLPEEK